MKNLKYLLTMLYLQNSLCTFDISIPEYQYISQQLTPEECRRLYAALHIPTFDLPASIPDQNVPDVPCIKLLMKWDRGAKNWEGKTKSHVDVVRRLRQIGRGDLAEWLSKSVFKNLLEEINAALDTTFNYKTKQFERKPYKDMKKNDNEWKTYDSIMWAVLAALAISLTLVFIRLFMCCFKMSKKKNIRNEEIIELLSYGTLDSDQETIYECVGNHGEKINDTE